MNGDPVVSVIMPVYNVERYLAEAVESILSQTFGDFEFICVDDGSTDRSLEIVQAYAARDSRIRAIGRQNTGIVGALNDAVGMSRGQLLARMDGDDVSMPQRLAKQLAFLRGDSECVALGTGVMQIDPEGVPLGPRDMKWKHEEIEARLLRGDGLAMVHPTVVFRREALVTVGCYRKGYDGSEDLDLYLRLSEHGRLANLPEILLKYRRRPDNATGVGDEERVNARRYAIVQDTMRRRGLDPATVEVQSTRRARSVAEWHRNCAWIAVRAGCGRAARKHWRILFMRQPFSGSTWWLGIHAWLGGRTGAAISSVFRLIRRAVAGRGQPD